MERTDYSQLELFSQGQEGYNLARTSERRGSFFNYIRGYEKVILIIIAFVVVGIISFSMGVEKGKRLALNQTISTTPQEVTIPKESRAVQQPESSEKQGTLENYTVQLASYQNRDFIEKEVQVLRKKGFSPLVLSKGKYIVLCVGNFSNQQAAKSLLSEFEKQKRYKGCFIRRL